MGEDFSVTAGRGRYGQGDAVMPGQGRPDERAPMGDALPALGGKAFDIYLNGEAFWRNVPATVWTYRLGGCQVPKKWLSHRGSAWFRAVRPSGRRPSTSPTLHGESGRHSP